jgi:hypothetical protein
MKCSLLSWFQAEGGMRDMICLWNPDLEFLFPRCQNGGGISSAAGSLTGFKFRS